MYPISFLWFRRPAAYSNEEIMNVYCLNCQVVFNKHNSECKRSPRHFCSRSCAASYNNKGVQRNPPKPKQESIKLATEKIKQLTIAEYQSRNSVKNKHPSWKNSHIRDFNRNWNKELRQLPCQKCGYSAHVELAHIKPLSEFNSNAILAEVNNPRNILVLCPNHHWEFDHGILNLKDIPSR